MELLETIKKAVLPSIEKHQCYLYDVVYENEKNEWYLRIYIDKIEGFLDMETCVLVSEEINEIMDKHDFINNEYYLEVSSPGAERPLKNYSEVVKAVGEYVYVKFKQPKNGFHEIYGVIIEVNDSLITIEYKEKNRKKRFVVDYQNISLIRMAIEF